MLQLKTFRVVNYSHDVSRWQPDARERLERAALELFVDQGFAERTVPQITARAGLTTRTFFRHFADKREVLFGVEEELPALVARLMADAPASLPPLELVEQGLQTIAATRFQGQHQYLRARDRVIQADQGLREREMRKLSVLSEAIAQGFRRRRVDELTSALTAQIAVAVFSVTLNRWLDQDVEQPLADLFHDTLQALRAVTAEPIEHSPHAAFRSAAESHESAADRTVDLLAEDVGVAGVPASFLDHVDQHPSH